jgi:membrane protein implicated in regulation of membrane protease activity
MQILSLLSGGEQALTALALLVLALVATWLLHRFAGRRGRAT